MKKLLLLILVIGGLSVAVGRDKSNPCGGLSHTICSLTRKRGWNQCGKQGAWYNPIVALCNKYSKVITAPCSGLSVNTCSLTEKRDWKQCGVLYVYGKPYKQSESNDNSSSWYNSGAWYNPSMAVCDNYVIKADPCIGFDLPINTCSLSQQPGWKQCGNPGTTVWYNPKTALCNNNVVKLIITADVTNGITACLNDKNLATHVNYAKFKNFFTDCCIRNIQRANSNLQKVPLCCHQVAQSGDTIDSLINDAGACIGNANFDLTQEHAQIL